MKYYEAESTIKASPAIVWSVLTDARAITSWDSGVQRLDGRIALGEKLSIVSKASPGRAFAATVTEFVPGKRMVWSGGMPLGLFKGVRTFTLTADGNGSTRFHVREEYTGPMLGMIWKSMPDLGPSFTQFASGLKARAEEVR